MNRSKMRRHCLPFSGEKIALPEALPCLQYIVTQFSQGIERREKGGDKKGVDSPGYTNGMNKRTNKMACPFELFNVNIFLQKKYDEFRLVNPKNNQNAPGYFGPFRQIQGVP